ncbi:hypothetical protein E4T39_08368 [Aureobasidium subglaciale]|nr:hypothetical protein E4T39_08368 [Aureobasidium subglaciale]
MPYRGKPSQGCDECRKRRKKCDLKPGGCSRCTNARRQCPGYPQANGLRICDQSFEVATRVRGTRSKDKEVRKVSTPLSSPLDADNASDNSPLALSAYPSPLSMDSDDLCFAFFFNNCVINNNMYHPFVHRSGNDHVIASIKAFGIANLSKRYSDKRLLTSAQHHYATALGLTNIALRDPSQVKRDETLLAILVLTNYETLTGGVTRSLDAWEQHINGSASLLSLRGLEGVQGKAGRVLTLHVIIGINVICLLRCLATPPFIHLLQTKIFEYLFEPENPAVQFQQLSLDCADFRYAVSCRLITSPEDIISRAAELDAKLTAVFADVPSSWEGEFIAHYMDKRSVEGGLPSFELRYTDQATAYIWASYRSSRIMVNEIVLQSLAEIKDTYRFAWRHSQTIVRQCQTEILAGMPQYTSQGEEVSCPGLQRPARYFVPEAVTSDLPVMRALSSFGVIWPLFVASTCSTTTPEIRNYVAGVYRYFGEELQIEQALVLGRMVQSLPIASPLSSPGSGSAGDEYPVEQEHNR